MKDQEKNLLQSWLDKLQQESWQLELLISGFAIFGLFSLKNYIMGEMITYYANTHQDLSLLIGYQVLVVIYLETQIFIINLLVHILIRGLWIGAIGLRYVSGDIDYTQLKYNDRFIKYYKRTVGSFDKYIIGLEKVSSVIFSFTFLLFFVFISFFLFISMSALIFIIITKLGYQDYDRLILIINIIWLSAFGLVAFDFITLGLIKRIKQRHFAAFYIGLYKVVGVLTLSFLWRPLLLNFLDQKYTKRLLFAIVPYIFLLVIILPNNKINQFEYFLPIRSTPASSQLEMSTRLINEHAFNSQFYDDMRSHEPTDFTVIRSISLPSNKVKGPLFEVFTKYTIGTEHYLEHQDSTLLKLHKIGFSNTSFTNDDYSVYTKKEKKKIIKNFLAQAGDDLDKSRKSAIRDSLNQVFKEQSERAYAKNILKLKKILHEEINFFIDNQPVNDSLISMDFYIHPNKNEKGLLCFFPIDLSLGRHTFSYHKKYLKNRKKGIIDTFKVTIPFIYVGK